MKYLGRKLMLFAGLVTLAFSVMAADYMKVNCNFAKAGATSMWDGATPAQVKDNLLVIPAKEQYTTPLAELPANAKISVSLKASGSGQLSLLDYEADTLMTTKVLWDVKDAKELQEFSTQVASEHGSFKLALIGADGGLKVADIAFKVEGPGENLCRDSSFYGMFGINDWFVQNGGEDWDGLALGPLGSGTVVSDEFPGIGETVMITNEGTVISQQFPYNGEEMYFGVWCRQEDVTVGGKPWATAGVQVVYYDIDDNIIGHGDVTPRLIPGSHGWEYNLFRIHPGSLNAKVKSVGIWLRVFGGATGKFWADEVTIIKVGEGTDFVYDASQGEITVEPMEQPEKINPIWSGVDLSYASQIDLPNVRIALAELQKRGVTHLRTREFFSGDLVKRTVNADGTSNYDFSKVDSYMDFPVKELGLVMVPTIETVPTYLKTEGTHTPNDMVLWGELVEALVNHWLDRYGNDVVSEWIFECWNEPGSDFFRGTSDEFSQIFQTYLKVMKKIMAERNIKLRIAPPSGAMLPLLSKIIREAYAAGLTDIITDQSQHIYGGYDTSMQHFPIYFKEVTERMEPYGLADKPMHITEFNGSAMVSKHFDTAVGAAYLVKANRMMEDIGMFRSYYYSVIDHPYLNLENHFTGDLGYFGHYGTPKATVNALELMNNLNGSTRLKLTSKSEPFDGWAGVADDGTIRVLVTTFSELELGIHRKVPVNVTVAYPDDAKYSAIKMAIVDSKNANAFYAFDQAGQPKYADNPDTTAMAKAAELKYVPYDGKVVHENGELKFSFEMEMNSVMELEIIPAK